MLDLKGVWVAIVTPFKQGEVDLQSLEKLVDWYCEQGADGIVACGTTGEAATLNSEEYQAVVKTIIQASHKRLPVIVGTGTNDTQTTLERTRMAKELGAEAALVVSPYYNKPTQSGLLAHFQTVAQRCKFPILLYNIQGRSGVNIAVDTMISLSKEEFIIGVKEASGNLCQVSALIAGVRDDFFVLSGEDELTLPMLALGAHGVISASANVVCEEMSQMVKAALANDWQEARRLHYKILPMFKALFWETNPIPVKTALAAMGKIHEEFRLPMCPMTEENRARLIALLEQLSYTCK